MNWRHSGKIIVLSYLLLLSFLFFASCIAWLPLMALEVLKRGLYCDKYLLIDSLDCLVP